MKARSILIATTACVALAIAVAGCSSGSAKHTPAAGSTASSGAAPAGGAGGSGGSGLHASDCSSVPASRVNAALGTSVTGPTETSGNAVMCQYAAGGNPAVVIIRIEANSTLDEMKATRKLGDGNGIPSTDLAGLGDAAYTTSISTPGLPTVTTVDAQKGGLNVQVSAAVSQDTIKAFVAQLIG